ncbi:hypothetical protein OKA04_06920 [Luteolibacter flavescens]|uniref:Prepilin-type N-terminal cleavage/methylation domain-containing protein n=1 Tax=Luteolibacter flavescens TaxID=1859460 RepID=A0ABT3FLJ6_9BACT|nr:hypothetical protein [Luteolibacter flavescens]MCW1884457.1 hypothetical protein [Luteolibacter flavescens]
MKLTRITKRAKGMTLLELTVVILVLLSLISILFVGARAWKKGSDRAANIMNIRNVQQAVRSYQNMNNKPVGFTIATTATTDGPIFGAGQFIEKVPTHPVSSGVYAFTGSIPTVGTLFMTGSLSDYEPAATDTSDW